MYSNFCQSLILQVIPLKKIKGISNFHREIQVTTVTKNTIDKILFGVNMGLGPYMCTCVGSCENVFQRLCSPYLCESMPLYTKINPVLGIVLRFTLFYSCILSNIPHSLSLPCPYLIEI